MNGSRVELTLGFRQSPALPDVLLPTKPAETKVSAGFMWRLFSCCYFLPALLSSSVTKDWPAGVALTWPPTMSRALTVFP